MTDNPRHPSENRHTHTLHVAYRTTDFLFLFLRRQFERTAVWVVHLLLIALSGMAGIVALALSLSGQQEQLSELVGWLILPPILFVLAAGTLLYVSYANAKVLVRFYQEAGQEVRFDLSDQGIRMNRPDGALSVSWNEITRTDKRRSALVFWKGPRMPLVFPMRCLDAPAKALLTAALSEQRPEPEAAAAESVPEDADEPEAADVPDIPDYTDSEYQFGDDWVPGGIRFHIEIRAEDRETLIQYSMVRPGTRRLLLVFAVLPLILGLVMTSVYTGAPPDTRGTVLFFAVLAFAFSALFWVSLIRPLLFLRIAAHFPGSRKRRQHDAVRQVLCVLDDGNLYVKTEGLSDKIPVAALHDIRRFRNRILLFRTKKQAYIIPLEQLEQETKEALVAALGDRLRS